MLHNGKEVFTKDNFWDESRNVGDLVEAGVVMAMMDALPPACMRLNCAQMGEPYSHRFDDISM